MPTPEDRTPPALLRQAAELIEAALVQLDMANTKCRCCGIERFRNMPHARTYQRFTDTAAKLRDAAAQLQANEEPQPRRGRA